MAGPAGMEQEVELKFELTLDAAQKLLASQLLPEEPKVLKLRTPYFDTPGRHLSAAGFTLRIRDRGDVRIQTVKAAGTAVAGLFARPEWERVVDSDCPVLDESTPLLSLLGEAVHEVGPLFEVRVERLVWDMVWEKARIEVVLDRGQVTTGERSAPICEIELELKSGKPASLFSLARRIGEIAPLHVGVVNKAERGFHLLAAAPNAVKAGPVHLDPQMGAADAFRHIAGVCLRQFRLNEPFVERRNSDAVHQARVALRRLRSAFWIFAPILRDGQFSHLREETRWLANSLGEARDVDVLLAEFDRSDAMRAELEQMRQRAYAAADEALASPRARALMLDLSQWLALGDWLARPETAKSRAMKARDFASGALERLRRKVKREGRDLETMSDDLRHDLRKDAKKLRYAVEFFMSLYDDKRSQRRAKRFLAALAELQDSLGALNDLAMAQDRLESMRLEEDLAEPAKAAKKKQELLEEAAEAHDAFIDAKRFWR